MALTFHIHTYGCQMNARDSEALGGLLRRVGYTEASEDEAKLLIVNTCSVREKAEDKAIGKLGLLIAEKRQRPDLIVGVVGCMAQRLGKNLIERNLGLDFVLGTHRLHMLATVVECVRAGMRGIVETDGEGDEPTLLKEHAEGRISALVNVLLGCNRRCAYCIVPTVRGREWSRHGEDILDEVRRLAANGVREVTLLGQSVLDYGRSNPVWSQSPRVYTGPREPFARLLDAVAQVEGIRRVRFTSGHPSGVTDELVSTVSGRSSICAHLHLPLQSGSDAMLKRMRRGYTAETYTRAVDRLRGLTPDFGLSTDIIVGFCGETDSDFEKTRDLMKRVQFENAFIFKYSPRSGTAAAEWSDDVPPEVKAERNAILLADQDEAGMARNRRLLGRAVTVLVEGPSLRKPDRWAGRTEANTIAVFDPKPTVQPGDVVAVTIERVKPQTLYGVIA